MSTLQCSVSELKIPLDLPSAFREAQASVREKVLDRKYQLYQFQMLQRLMQRAVIYPEALARSMQGE